MKQQVEIDRIKTVYKNRTRSSDEKRYSYFDAGNLFIIQRREYEFIKLFKRIGFDNLQYKKILEIGCGTGYWLLEFIKWGARPGNITGIDLLSDRLVTAKERCPEGVHLECRSASRMANPDETFDIVLQSTVFTSILDLEMRRVIAREMIRVLKKDGLILWYDFFVNNPANPDVRGVKKAEIQLLFPDCQIELRRVTLAPPIARFLAPYAWSICYLMDKIPLLRTHYLGVIRKR